MKNENQIKVEVKDMPELNVAYIRHIGPYKGDSLLFKNLFDKLMQWAGSRDIFQIPGTLVLVVYHDDPKIAEENNLRTSACITIPDDMSIDGEIGKMIVPGGKFAVARFEIGGDEFENAWDMLYGGWLPESGYQPDDRLCYEICYNNPDEHKENKHIIDICIPIKPL